MMLSNSLDDTVERAKQWIDDSDALDLLRRLIGIDSRWSHPVGVEEVGRTVAERLENVGFDVERVPQPALPAGDRWLAELLAPDVAYETLAGTLVARRDGSGDRRLLIIGDLDTAFSHEDLGGSLFAIDEDRVTGVGVADMKAGLVTMVSALECVAENDFDSPPITVVLAGDEQAGSLGSRQTISAEAEASTWAVCMECARDGGNLMASRAEVGVGVVEALGREAHAGTARESGANAIEMLCGVVAGLVAPFAARGDILVTPTIISGGRRRSVVPSTARLVLDLRAVDRRRWNEMAGRLAETVAGGAGSLELRAAAHRPALIESTEGAQLVDLMLRIGAALGLRHGSVGSMAAGSSAFASEGGCAVVDGMGPPGGDLMTPGEWVSKTGIAERGAVLAAALGELPRQPPRKSGNQATNGHKGGD